MRALDVVARTIVIPSLGFDRCLDVSRVAVAEMDTTSASCQAPPKPVSGAMTAALRAMPMQPAQALPKTVRLITTELNVGARCSGISFSRSWLTGMPHRIWHSILHPHSGAASESWQGVAGFWTTAAQVESICSGYRRAKHRCDRVARPGLSRKSVVCWPRASDCIPANTPGSQPAGRSRSPQTVRPRW